MVWLPIYQVCEFAHRHRALDTSKVHPFEEGAEGGDVEQARETAYLADGPGRRSHIAAEAETPSRPSAGAGSLKLTLSDQFLSEEELKKRSRSLEGWPPQGQGQGHAHKESEDEGNDKESDGSIVDLLGARAENDQGEIEEV
jgi:hypothetical protein